MNNDSNAITLAAYLAAMELMKLDLTEVDRFDAYEDICREFAMEAHLDWRDPDVLGRFSELVDIEVRRIAPNAISAALRTHVTQLELVEQIMLNTGVDWGQALQIINREKYDGRDPHPGCDEARAV